MKYTKNFFFRFNEKTIYQIPEYKYQNCFGYPITTNGKFSMDDFGNTIHKGQKRLLSELNNNIILMDLYKKNKTQFYPNESEPEIYVKFENGRGNVKVQVHRNKSLIKEKKKKIIIIISICLQM